VLNFGPTGHHTKDVAPLKQNDALLEMPPIGVLGIPGHGIQPNCADKARKFSIPVWKIMSTTGRYAT
jgi:hypothetical protein